ncbi:L-lactate dehydrogenase [Thermophilibacter sp.]
MHDPDIRTRKVVIIGAGRVGSHVALCLMFQHLVNEIVFVDVNSDAARAQALDLDDLASGLGDSFTIRVGDYADCKDAHFVILTAGRSRKPGETRLQMLDGTIKVLGGIVGPLRESGFHGILISVSNPADIVAEYLYRSLGLPRNQVFGTGTALDSARLRRVLSETIDVGSRQIQAFCIGEHGDSMFIPTSRISVEGIGLREYLSLRNDVVDNIDFDDVMRRVRESGAAIISGKGCTEFGIASIVATLVTSILHNEKRVVPLSTHLDGEYGESGISVGVPCVIGDTGVDAVLEIDLSYDERRAMRRSCSIIRENLEKVLPEA